MSPPAPVSMKQRPPVRPRYLSKTPRKPFPPLADAISETASASISGLESLALTLPISNQKHTTTFPNTKNDHNKYFTITSNELCNNYCHNYEFQNTSKQQFTMLNNAKNHIYKVMNTTFHNMNTMIDRTSRTITSGKRRRQQRRKKKLLLGDGLLYDVQGNIISDDISVTSPNSLLYNEKGLDRYVQSVIVGHYLLVLIIIKNNTS